VLGKNGYKIFFLIITILISVFFITIDISNFLRTISSKTDQNLYTDPPSRFYVKNSFKIKIFNEKNKKYYQDSIHTGYLIISINDSIPKNLEQYRNLMIEARKKNIIKIEFINPKEINPNFMRQGFFQIKKAEAFSKDIPEDIIRYLESAVVIGYVEKGGASDRAGLKLGDIIIRINGENFENAFEANNFLQKGEKGKYLVYDVLRDNKIEKYQVQIIKLQISINYLIIFIIGLIYLALGIFISLSRPQYKSSRLIGTAFILLGYYISSFLIPVTSDGKILYHIYFLSILTSAFGFPVFIHALVYFPRKREDMLESGWVIKAPYIYGTALTITVVLNLFILKSSILTAIILNIIYSSVPIFILYYFVVLLIFKKHRSKEEAGLSRFINLTFLIIFSISVITIILNILSESPQSTVYLASLVLIPLSFIYTIGRHKLYNLEFRIKKNIQYILISATWKIILITLIILSIWVISDYKIQFPNLHFTGTSIEILEYPLSKEQQEIYNNISLIFISLIGIFIFKALNKQGQYLLDKKYYRMKFDYKKASTDFSEILEMNIDLKDLAEKIINGLAGLLHLKNSGILFYRNEETIAADYYYGFIEEGISEYYKLTVKKQIENIKKFNSEIRVEYIEKNLREIYQKCEFKYIIPIRSKAQVLGAIMLGDKMSEVPYHRDDFEFLNTLTGQISVAIENAFLYEELTQRERIKHELDLARKIQLASLPKDIPEIEGLKVSGISLPAHEVGGDFYDFLSINNELTVIVGDVSGKGTSAAIYMSKIQGMIRTLHEFNLSPKQLLIKSNRLLYGYIEKSSFITAICAKINTSQKEIKIARAGHLPMYYFNNELKEIETVLTKGIVLGMTNNNIYEENLEEKTINFKTGDIFLFVSDGVTEARNSLGNEFNTSTLLNVLNEHYKDEPEVIRNEILLSLKKFTEDTIQFDDITVVVIKVT
jgi:phosphoserine phosphatase RsbU/P